MRLFGFARKQVPTDKNTAFWDWFAANEARFRDVCSLDDRTIGEVGTAIRSVCPELTFEFGVGPGDERLFVVSAEGIRSVFPAVVDLVNAAPPIAGWRIVAFRQPRDTAGVQLNGVRYTAESFYYAAEECDGLLDIVLHCPGLDAHNEAAIKGATFLLLDSLLGEFDVATRIGAIDWVPLREGAGDPRLRPLPDLPHRLAKLGVT